MHKLHQTLTVTSSFFSQREKIQMRKIDFTLLLVRPHRRFEKFKLLLVTNENSAVERGTNVGGIRKTKLFEFSSKRIQFALCFCKGCISGKKNSEFDTACT